MPSLAASFPPAEARVPRHKVFLPAEMIGSAGPVRVHLLNLSVTGALAYADRLPQPRSVVRMRCGDTTWLARIVWAHDKRFGVVHIVPLPATTVTALLGG